MILKEKKAKFWQNVIYSNAVVYQENIGKIFVVMLFTKVLAFCVDILSIVA